MNLAQYLQTNAILLQTEAKEKNLLLAELVEKVAELSQYEATEKILAGVLEREKIRSTGFGKGLAVAHARMEPFPKICVVLARPSVPIEWGSLDGEPVEFVVLVVGPTVEEAKYLQVLSEVTKLWARKETRALLLSALTPEEVLRVILESKTRSHPR